MTPKQNSEVQAMEACLTALSDLDTGEQKRVLAWLSDKLNLKTAVGNGADSAPRGAPISANAQTQTVANGEVRPKQFVAQKKPTSDAERITCLAYYLAHFRGVEQCKTKELTDLGKEAAIAPFSNATVAVNNARASQYLAPAGGGKKQITVRGEAVVEALPDREKVAAALAENAVRHRKVGKGKKRKGA